MKHCLKTPHAAGVNPSGQLDRRDALVLAALASALALAGCGGGANGGSVAGVTSGGTGSFTTGVIIGFGSIIVGTVRFDDSKASSIVDADDNNADLRGQLRLGMVVRVKGQAKVGASADAEMIEVRSELLGPVSRIDATTLTVLGQTVSLSVTTVFGDGLTGLASLAVNTIVEVHGFVDALNNTITATRIERKSADSVKAYKLQGNVRGLTANTFQIGDLVISAAAATVLPSSLVLANGLLVRLRLEPTMAAGARKATSIRSPELEVLERAEADIEGTITGLTSNSQFSVNGLAVQASGAAVPPGLKLGDRVSVQGALVKGVLVAKSVKLEDEKDPLKFELNGTVSSLSKTAKTFSVRGVTVDYSAAEFRNGTEASLLDAVTVEVKGVAVADGNRIKATRISFK